MYVSSAETYNSSSDSYKTDVPLAETSLEVLSLIPGDKVRIVYHVAVCEVPAIFLG